MTTSADIIYQRRVRWLELVAELGNVSAACRQIGVSRTRYYEWNKIVADYGIEALWPKSRRNHSDYMAGRTPVEILDNHIHNQTT